jgi:hypothetical protein
MDAGEARQLTAGYIGRMARGSMMALSCVRNDDEASLSLARRAVQPAATLHNHSREDIAGFFAGLRLVDPPGVVPARAWRAGMPDAALLRPADEVFALTAVAVKD